MEKQVASFDGAKKVQETPITESGLIGLGFTKIKTVSRRHGWVTYYDLEGSIFSVKEYDLYHKKYCELYAVDVRLRRVATVEQLSHILFILTEGEQ